MSSEITAIKQDFGCIMDYEDFGVCEKKKRREVVEVEGVLES